MEQIEGNGLFYRLKSEERTNFVMSEYFYSVLPKDYIDYTRLDNGSVYIDKIVKRKDRMTIGIFDTNKKRLRLPLISKQFCMYLNYSSFLQYHFILCYVTIINNEIYITKEIGNIQDRKHDFECFSKVYSNTNINIEIENTYSESFLQNDEVKDQRMLYTFNIDPKGSLDFDDAISIDSNLGIIYIHIVDIDYHLKQLSKENVEKRAFEIGQTLYLSEGNVNLFPKEYCDYKFSLVKEEERPVLTLEYHVETDSYRLYRSIIIIKKKYDYESAQEALEKGDDVLVYLDKVIQKPRWIYSSFQLPQRKLFIKNGELERIEFHTSNRVNKIIEALMIMTNRKVTEHLEGIIPERYHKESNKDILIDTDNPIDIIEKLKAYKLAKYSNVDSGHYALKIPLYTHFTSPIRRSFDIIIHHILTGSRYSSRTLTLLVEHINDRCDENTRIVDCYEKCKLLSYFEKNTEHLMILSSITKNGINVYLPESGYYDFIHISKIMKGVRWNYSLDEKLVGTNGSILKKGTECFVSICSINWFELAVNEYIIREFL
jgi:exoribonuclease R